MLAAYARSLDEALAPRTGFICAHCAHWHPDKDKHIAPDDKEYCPECLPRVAEANKSKALIATERWLRMYGWEYTELYQQVQEAIDWDREVISECTGNM